METPKKSNSYSETDDVMSTPSTSSSTKKGCIVTPGSDDSSKGTRVQEPHDHDVLCGRGGSINSHPGNERFRQLVEKRKRVYLTARFKREKRLIANSILSEIRSLQPPGRFLSRDTKTATWYDIGDEKARDKTSQALRENAPSIRAEIEVEINQQRAQIQRAEDEAAYTAPPSGPPHPYYKQPWGFYAPYHGYGQYSHPGAEPPRHPYDERYERQWHGQYADWGDHPPPAQQQQCQSPANASVSSRRPDESQHYSEAPEQQQHAPPPPPPQEGEHVAGFDVPTFVSSVPSSIAAWTRTSFSFGGHSHASEHEPATNPPKPPLPYTHQSPSHEQDRQGRRVVHFKDDGRSPHYPYQQQDHGGQRRYPPAPGPQGGAAPDYYDYSPPLHGDGYQQQQGEGTSSFPPNHPATANTPESAARKATIQRPHQALEPHNAAAPYQAGEQHSSLLSQVATHILGSWDTSMVCANSSHEEPMMTMGNYHHHDQQGKPLNTPSSEMMAPPLSLADAMEDDEQEGQEVELVDMMDYDDPDDLPDHPHDDDDIRDDIDRMPPPEGDMPPPPRRIEIDWPSKMVGCQSNWLPETFNQSSFFNKQPNVLSPSASLEMDVSAAGTEGISCTDSIGGASLCQVFSHDQIADGEVEEPLSPMEQPELSQMPSWERSVRSKSPSPDDFT